MIVIATHNGYEWIENNLKAWNEFGTEGHTVSIVETGASEPSYRPFLDDLSAKGWDFPVHVFRTPSAGYDTGAYLWAAHAFPDEEHFFFCHDSMKVKRPGVMGDFKRIDEELSGGCVPWLVFRQNGYQNEEQHQFVSEFYPNPELPGYGVFGPIFYISRTALQKVEALNPFWPIPHNKNEQEAMERGWAVAFNRAGVPVQSLDGDFYGPLLHADQYPSFTKYLPQRQ